MILSKVEDFIVIGNTGRMQEAKTIIATKNPQVILVDTKVIRHVGLSIIREIRDYTTTSKIIGVSSTCNAAYVKKIKEYGGNGYLTKTASYKELVDAVHTAINGLFFLTENTRQCLEAYETFGYRSLKLNAPGG